MEIIPYRERTLDESKPVHVYRNLGGVSRARYSVRQSGLVIGHCWEVYLKDCVFRVSEAGRKRVLKEGRKNVHAYVKGFISPPVEGYPDSDWLQFRYNPYLCGAFCLDWGELDKAKLTKADVVYLGSVAQAVGGEAI